MKNRNNILPPKKKSESNLKCINDSLTISLTQTLEKIKSASSTKKDKK